MDDDEEKQENRWGAVPGRGELCDLDFDFKAFFSRDHSDFSEQERVEWPGRIYAYYCSTFYKSGGDVSAIPSWVAAYVADRLFEALSGGPWGEVMQLPWDERFSIYNAKGERAFAIYAHVENTRRVQPEANVTDLIAGAAQQHCVSYETARADYYALKKAITWKTEIPPKFLKKDGDF